VKPALGVSLAGQGRAKTGPVSDAALEAHWKNVLDHWDEDRAHGAFLEHCQRSGQLAEAAARYRGMTGDRARADTARQRLAGVGVLAMASLEAARTPERTVNRQAGALVLLIFFVAATLALLAYLSFSR
jgi:hypothetical protein